MPEFRLANGHHFTELKPNIVPKIWRFKKIQS